jgi:hypothetical protein
MRIEVDTPFVPKGAHKEAKAVVAAAVAWNRALVDEEDIQAGLPHSLSNLSESTIHSGTMMANTPVSVLMLTFICLTSLTVI